MRAAVTAPPATHRVRPGGVVATGLALAGAGAALALRDPGEVGWLPACQFNTLKGWW